MLDLTNVQESGPQILPVGTYNVISDDASVKETKSGGEQILVVLKVLDGEYAGRTIYHSFNTKNANPKAVEIGLSQLKGFMRVSGINSMILNSVVELVGYKSQAVVKHRTDDYGTKAVVSYFKAYEKPVEEDIAF